VPYWWKLVRSGKLRKLTWGWIAWTRQN